MKVTITTKVICTVSADEIKEFLVRKIAETQPEIPPAKDFRLISADNLYSNANSAVQFILAPRGE